MPRTRSPEGNPDAAAPQRLPLCARGIFHAASFPSTWLSHERLVRMRRPACSGKPCRNLTGSPLRATATNPQARKSHARCRRTGFLYSVIGLVGEELRAAAANFPRKINALLADIGEAHSENFRIRNRRTRASRGNSRGQEARTLGVAAVAISAEVPMGIAD